MSLSKGGVETPGSSSFIAARLQIRSDDAAIRSGWDKRTSSSVVCVSNGDDGGALRTMTIGGGSTTERRASAPGTAVNLLSRIVQLISASRKLRLAGFLFSAASTLFVLLAIVSPAWYELSGDTSSLENGQEFTGDVGLYLLCSNVWKDSNETQQTSSDCRPVTDALVVFVQRMWVVANYHVRYKCTDRTMENARPRLQVSGAFVAFGFLVSVLGTALSVAFTWLRPEDKWYFASRSWFLRRVAYNPFVGFVLHAAVSGWLLMAVAIFSYFLESWLACGTSFCDLCHFTTVCSCGMGWGMVSAILALCCSAVASLLLFIAWFQLSCNGSSVECPCPE